MSFKAWAQTKIPVAHRVIKTVHETKTMRIRDVKELMLGDPIHYIRDSTQIRYGLFERYEETSVYGTNRVWGRFDDDFNSNFHRISPTYTNASSVIVGWPHDRLQDDALISSSNPLGELLPNGFRVGERVYYVTTIGRDNSYRDTGTIVRNPRSIEGVPAENAVWANWDNGSTPGWMYTNNVFRV